LNRRLALTTTVKPHGENRGEFDGSYNPAFAEPESEKCAAIFAASASWF
jgi:hypothetical protein